LDLRVELLVERVMMESNSGDSGSMWFIARRTLASSMILSKGIYNEDRERE